MKLNKLMMVSLLFLAIITLGAVSASENDNLTASEIAIDDSFGDDVLAVEENSLISDDDRRDAYVEFHFPEQVRNGERWWDDYDYQYVAFYDDDIGGNVSLLIDNEVADSQSVESYGYYFEDIKLYDLGLAPGLHNITVNYSGDDSYRPFVINRTFELYDMRAVVPETVEIGGDSFRMIFAMDTTGVVDLYIDGEKLAGYDAYEDRYDENEDEMTPFIYVDFSRLDCAFGPHDYRVEYYGGNHEDKNVSGSFNLDYCFFVSAYGYVYGEPVEFTVWLPDDAKGNITLVSNGRTHIIRSEGHYTDFDFDDVDYGENSFTLTYEDGRYPEKTVDASANLVSSIIFNIPYNHEVFYNSSNQNMSLLLPGDAKGNLSVYIKQYDSQIGEYANVLFATAPLTNGTASLPVPNLEFGSHDIVARYTGDDYEVEELNRYYRVVPNVGPLDVREDSIQSTRLTIEVPPRINNTLKVAIEEEDSDEWGYNPIYELYNGEFKSLVLQLPANLTGGKYTLKLRGYDEEYQVPSYWSYPFCVRQYGPDLELDVVCPEIVSKFMDVSYEGRGLTSEYRFFPHNVPGDCNGVFRLYIDDKVMCVRLLHDDGEFDCDLKGLSLGNHTWKVTFTEDSYYTDTQINGSFEVVVLPDTIRIGKDRINFYAYDAVGYISLKIDGKDYAMEFLNSLQNMNWKLIDIGLDGITPGKHNYTLIYSDDNNWRHEAYNGTFDAVRHFSFEINVDESSRTYRNPQLIEILIEDDATGNVTVEVGGKSYTEKIVNASVKFEVPDLEPEKIYTVTAKYSGDDKYPSCEISKDFEMYGWRIDYDEFNVESFRLSLPSDAAGNLVISSGYVDEDYNFIENETLAVIPLKNGNAFCLLSDCLEPGLYANLIVRYDGDDYDVAREYDELCYINVYPYVVNCTIPEEFSAGGNGNITFELPEGMSGSLSVLVDDDEFSAFSLTGGINIVEVSGLSQGYSYIDAVYSYENGQTRRFSEYVYVPKPQPEFSVTSLPDSETPVITIDLSDNAAGALIVSINGRNYYTGIENSTVTLTVPDLADGTYDVTIKYSGDRKHSGFAEYADVTVKTRKNPVDPNITIVPVDDVEIGCDAVIIITASETFTGNVSVEIADANYTVNVANGTGSINVTGLAAGQYLVRAISEASELFTASEANATFEVVKLTPEIIITSGEAIEGSDLEVAVEIEGATGNVTVNGEIIELCEGKAAAAVKNVAAGELTVDVAYAGDDRYLNVTASVNVTVRPKEDAGLEVSVSDITVGENATVNVKINENATGTLRIELGNGTYDVEIQNGTAALSVADLEAGEYDVTVSFEGDRHFKASNATADFTVSKVEIGPEVDPFIPQDNATEEPDVLVYSIELPEDATGNLTVTIGNKTYSQALVKGCARIEITDLDAGDYNATVEYTGDAKYSAISKTSKGTVRDKADAGLKITVSDINVGENATVTVEINANATGKVTVDGSDVQITDGSAVIIKTGLAEGEYTVNAVFEGDKIFKQANATAAFRVSKVELDPAADPFVPQDNATNASKNPVYTITMPADATGNLTVTIANKTYTQALENGHATIEITDLAFGSYNATVAYTGDAKYAAIVKTENVSVRVDPVISATDLTVRFCSGSEFRATVYGDDGKAASNVTVIFKLNGVAFANATTDADGVAGFIVTQLPGKYIITTEALGANTTNTLSVKQILKLKTVKVKRSAKKLVLTATLKKVNGKYLTGKVTFKFAGKKFKAKINRKGVAKATVKSKYLKKLKVGKRVTYEATFKKDTVKKTAKVQK